jgi:hypothetical protein
MRSSRFAPQKTSNETQRFSVLGLYQQLSHYLDYLPSDKHALGEVAKQFVMIRKLKLEGAQFREVLMGVR